MESELSGEGQIVNTFIFCHFDGAYILPSNLGVVILCEVAENAVLLCEVVMGFLVSVLVYVLNQFQIMINICCVANEFQDLSCIQMYPTNMGIYQTMIQKLIYIYNHLDVHCSFEKLQMRIRRSDQQLCCLMLHSKWDLTGIQTHNSQACFWHI